MHLVLNVYTDDSLTEVKRQAEAEELKIPYRVITYVAQAFDTVDFKNENEIFDFIIKSMDKVDKILKATFGLSELELECINAAELVPVVKEIFAWATGKINGLKNGDDSKNVGETA